MKQSTALLAGEGASGPARHPDRNFGTIACVDARALGVLPAWARVAFGSACSVLAPGAARALGACADGTAPAQALPGLAVRRTLGLDGEGRVRVAALRAWLVGPAAGGDAPAPLTVVLNGEAGPYLCRPLQMGADVVVEELPAPGAACSADAEPGPARFMAVARTPGALERLAGLLAGCVPGPSWLPWEPDAAAEAYARLCLQTLALRAQRRSDTALALAHYLSMHPAVAWVSYPGLPDDASNDVARRTLEHGFGPLVAFALHGGATSVADVAPGPAPLDDGLSALAAGPRPGTLCVRAGLEEPLDVVAGLERVLAPLVGRGEA